MGMTSIPSGHRGRVDVRAGKHGDEGRPPGGAEVDGSGEPGKRLGTILNAVLAEFDLYGFSAGVVQFHDDVDLKAGTVAVVVGLPAGGVEVDRTSRTAMFSNSKPV